MEKDGEHKTGKGCFLGRCEQKRSWQALLPLTAERNGSANSDWKRMCGQGGDAAGAVRTSRQGCKGSIDRQSQQQQNYVHRDLRLQVGEKKRSRDGEAEIRELRE